MRSTGSGVCGGRPLSDSDTDIQPMIQLPDADKRKDQWFTEAGSNLVSGSQSICGKPWRYNVNLRNLAKKSVEGNQW